MIIQTALDTLKELLDPICEQNNIDCVLFSETQEQRGRAWMQNMLIIHFSGFSLGSPTGASKLSQSGCSPIQQIGSYSFELVLYSKVLRNERVNIYQAIEDIVNGVNGKRLVEKAGLLIVDGANFRSYEDSRYYLYGITAGFDFKQSFTRQECCD